MAHSAKDSRKTPLHIDAFWEKRYNHSTSIMGKVDTTVESRSLIEKRDSIGDSPEETARRGCLLNLTSL